ncbi:MAG TPA: hypothetical protein VIY48_06910 [Candidatus Paceibacterota bacterium]
MAPPRIYWPYIESTISQRFGENANTLYASDGLRGHPAIDFGVPYGTPILQCLEGAEVYSTMNRNNPDLMRYRAVCTMWDDPDSFTSYELIYGHDSDIMAAVGTTPAVGDTLAYVGNTGDVYTNGVAVTAAEKNAGSHAGSHLHFQLRKCLRVPVTKPDHQYIIDGNGLYQKNGCYYEVVDYANGYHGCLDPQPYLVAQTLAKDVPALINKYTAILALLKKVVSYLRG